MRFRRLAFGLACCCAVAQANAQANQKPEVVEHGSGLITFVGSAMVPACVLSVNADRRPLAAGEDEPQKPVAICSERSGAPVNAYFYLPAQQNPNAHRIKSVNVPHGSSIYVVEYQ